MAERSRERPRPGGGQPPCGQLADALAAIAAAPRPPRPWQDGARFPWHDPEFSRRVLAFHLDPATPMASRSPELAAAQAAWFDARLRAAVPAPPDGPRRVLDVGCGPGLYALELARRGHRVTGLDIGPAVLAHARRTAAARGLAVRFLQADLAALGAAERREIGPLEGAAFWYGEFHSFAPAEIRRFLDAMAALLVPGGLLLVEYVPAESFTRRAAREWRVTERSPFADGRHLWLQETHWDEPSRTEITVHWIVDGATGALQRHVQCLRCWREDEIAALLRDAGFTDVAFHPPVAGREEEYELPLVTARRA